MCFSSRGIRLAYRNRVGAVRNSGNLHFIHILRLLLSARVCTPDTSLSASASHTFLPPSITLGLPDATVVT